MGTAYGLRLLIDSLQPQYRQVARGDLRPTEIFASRDELGGLTKSGKVNLLLPVTAWAGRSR